MNIGHIKAQAKEIYTWYLASGVWLLASNLEHDQPVMCYPI